ncbi:MAG: hypothetical protein CMJ76_09070 [Planctomycetaceae bacterium]|nr:hypothetical protein [Planctomycetaceae bacterium]
MHSQKNLLTCIPFTICWLIIMLADSYLASAAEPIRVFIFAGQSNMVGSDSKVKDIDRFPPFRGLEQPQKNVLFSYSIGRENKLESNGWVDLQPVNNVVGPELSFARTVTQSIDTPIAIIKVAAGGTHLGGDWNPDEPIGFKMYPLALKVIQQSLKQLKDQGHAYQIEGFMWHQGENDMFNEEYMPNYGKNLKNFLSRWRTDLKTPELRFYIGELCTKTIWGMDLRPRMYAICLGQKEVAANDKLAQYIPTSHVGVEIGGGVGLHYHYGTLGQLEHGENYATAYLQNIGVNTKPGATKHRLNKLPYTKRKPVKLFILAGHRNMEGERAFTQELEKLEQHKHLVNPQGKVAYSYNIGGGYKISQGWEAMRPAGYYDNFGPEISFAAELSKNSNEQIAIAKFTHSGSQIIDWTPEGSMAKTRHLYPAFIDFIKKSHQSLTEKGYEVEIAGIFYHLGENDMSFYPYRKDAASRLQAIVNQSRLDLDAPDLNWYVSQQPPTDDERVNKVDVVSMVEAIAEKDTRLHHIKVFDLPVQEKKLVISTAGILQLGESIADFYLAQ